MLQKVNQVKIHIYVEYIFFTHRKNSKPSNEPRAIIYLLNNGQSCGITTTLQNHKDAYWRSATLLGAKLSTFLEIFQNIV